MKCAANQMAVGTKGQNDPWVKKHRIPTKIYGKAADPNKLRCGGELVPKPYGEDYPIYYGK